MWPDVVSESGDEMYYPQTLGMGPLTSQHLRDRAAVTALMPLLHAANPTSICSIVYLLIRSTTLYSNSIVIRWHLTADFESPIPSITTLRTRTTGTTTDALNTKVIRATGTAHLNLNITSSMSHHNQIQPEAHPTGTQSGNLNASASVFVPRQQREAPAPLVLESGSDDSNVTTQAALDATQDATGSGTLAFTPRWGEVPGQPQVHSGWQGYDNVPLGVDSSWNPSQFHQDHASGQLQPERLEVS